MCKRGWRRCRIGITTGATFKLGIVGREICGGFMAISAGKQSEVVDDFFKADRFFFKAIGDGNCGFFFARQLTHNRSNFRSWGEVGGSTLMYSAKCLTSKHSGWRNG